MLKFRNILILSLLVLLMSQCAFSHQKTDALGSATVPDTEVEVIEIPFRILPNKTIAVRAKLDSQEGYFIFDNGSPVTMVNSKYFHPVRQRGSYNRLTDVSGVPVMGQGRYPSHELDLQGIVVKGREYVSMQMSQMIQDDGIETLGLIGAETIEGYDVLFNYADSVLTLLKPADTDAFLAARYPESRLHEVPLEVVEHAACVAVTIGEDTYQLALDCGAGGNVLSNTYHRQLAPHMRPIGATELVGVSRIPVRATEVLVHRLSIGEKLFTSVNFLLHNLRSMGIDTDDGIDGFVGFDILSQQKTLISMGNRRLIFID